MYEVQSTTWFTDSALDGIVASTINEMSAVALILCVSFFSLKLGWEWFKYSINSINDSNYVGKWFETNEVLRVCALIVILGIYPTLAGSVSKGIAYINATTDKSSTTKLSMEKISNEYHVEHTLKPQLNKVLEARRDLAAAESTGNSKLISAASHILKEEEKQFGAELVNQNGTTGGRQEDAPVADDSVWGLMTGGATNFVAVMINAVFGFIAMLMKWIISGYARVIFKLMLCIGPFAIAFSIFWRDKFLHWFESLLNIGFVFLVLNILDILVSDYFYQAVLGKNVGIGQSLAFNLAVIGAYLTAFRLSGMIVGKTGAHGMMNKSLMVAGAMVSAGIMGGAALFGGGGTSAAGASGASGSAGGSSSGGASGGSGNAGSRIAKASINSASNEAKKEE